MSNIQDIVALYQLAQTADIKVGQAREVAALLERVEAIIAEASVAEHLAKKAAQPPLVQPPGA